MTPIGWPWAALMDMQPQRTSQVAWFVYGWLQREQALNLNAWTGWWMRAAGWPPACPESRRLEKRR